MADEKEITLEELRDMAVKSVDESTTTEAETSTSGKVADQAQAEEQDEIVYRRDIDLGDGSGVQVFEGRTYEELIDKLATAQEHATRKIRELSQAKKSEEKVAQAADVDEWLLGQEIISKPTEAFGKIFERVVGMKPTDFSSKMERLTAFEAAKSAEDQAVTFVQTHPDYAATPANGRRMGRYLELYKLEPTVENMEKAFTELADSGLLEARDEKPAVETEEQNAETERIAQPVEKVSPASQRKAASGLSGRRSPAPAPKPQGPTEEELDKMPLHKLRDLAVNSLTGSN